MNRAPVRRKNRSFFTAIILTVALIMIWVMHQGLNNSGLPPGLANLLNADFENFRNLEQFSEERTDEVKKHIAGFWVFSSGDEISDPVAKREYLEIIDNGIIWHVKQWFINDPIGGRHVLTRVAHGYTRPFSYSQDGNVYLSETRTMRQAFIAPAPMDSCYGSSQHDEMWQISLNGNLLTVNQREYAPYNGELSEFFPADIDLDIVDKITLRKCAAVDLSRLAKRVLARSFIALPATARSQSAESLINTYYKPIVFDELVRRYDPRGVPDEMQLQFTLNGDGSISNLRNRSAQLVTKRFDDMAELDIGSWLFPPSADDKEPRRIDLTVRVR
ncbi:MAG: hypothetical protein FWE57_11870 [Chitinispirillia bacterium]|nr:hypothetical protein [Chitinispirillia bacterium]